MKKLKEILDNLKNPIPSELILTKSISGRNIAYVNVWQLIDLLDERCSPENWELKLSCQQVADSVVVIASLTIHGEDRSLTREATGEENSDLNSYGDPPSNASAQAIRRACSLFGLGRQFWFNKNSSQNPPRSQSNQLSQLSRKKDREISREEWEKRQK